MVDLAGLEPAPCRLKDGGSAFELQIPFHKLVLTRGVEPHSPRLQRGAMTASATSGFVE